MRARQPKSRFAGIVLRLMGVNILLPLLAFITSPILARALGPVGRGEIAAVFAVVNVMPWITALGMSEFLSRQQARRERPLGLLLGSSLPIPLLGSLVVVAAAVPLAHLLGHGRPEVVRFIEIGLFVAPLSACIETLSGMTIGNQRWRVFIIARVIYAGGTAATIVALSLLHALSVESVAVTYIAVSVLSNVPFLLELRGSFPWSFSRSVSLEGLRFGSRSWLTTVAATGNSQFDQLLMAGLVTSRQLGLYALAVTLATVTGTLVSATANALFPRVAAGERGLAERAARVSLALVVVFAVVIGAASPVFVPFVFGRAFEPMIPMLIVLLVASLFYVPGQVLGSALVASGNPSATARAQLVGFALTVPALFIVLPVAGGLGAAYVSLGAYAMTFLVIARAAARAFETSYGTLLVLTREDVRWVAQRAGLGQRIPAPSVDGIARAPEGVGPRPLDDMPVEPGTLPPV